MTKSVKKHIKRIRNNLVRKNKTGKTKTRRTRGGMTPRLKKTTVKVVGNVVRPRNAGLSKKC